MVKGLENLAEMEYPGRVIITGRDESGENNIVVYAVTGRSRPSQARKLEMREDGNIYTALTDLDKIKEGDESLLIYPAIVDGGKYLIVTNGEQTNAVKKYFADNFELYDMFGLHDMLFRALVHHKYEHDAPAYTPRISGAIKTTNSDGGLSILKKHPDDDSVVREFYSFPMASGEGRLITTYTGVNVNPLPSFDGEPLYVKLSGDSAQEVAENVYQALGPAEDDPSKDFRVALACVFSKEGPHLNGEDGITDYHIINSHELEKKL